MMSPAEHYIEAVRLLGEVTDLESFGDDAQDQAMVAALHARAQVHATLATVPWATYSQAADTAYSKEQVR